MKLLVIVLCLLSERYLIHQSALNRFTWFDNYTDKILSYLPKKSIFQQPYLQILVLLLPGLSVLALALFYLQTPLYGFFRFLIDLMVVYYCLGPENLFYPVDSTSVKSAQDERAAGAYLAQVNQQLFAIIFWYIVLGPLGVWAYRMVSLCQTQGRLRHSAMNLMNWFDWIPARITALLYLLVGNFQPGFQSFCKKTAWLPAENNALLVEVGVLAAHSSEQEKISLLAAQGLVLHAILMMLVFLALFTMVSWL